MDGVLLLFWNCQTELFLEIGCLLWGIRVVIPEKLQKAGIGETTQISSWNCVHEGNHQKWEGVDKDIELLVKLCQACQSVKNSPPTGSASLHPWLWPTKPWQHLHVDFAGPF